MYLAHISDDNREQTVKDHLLGTAVLCGQFAEAFGMKELGYYTGLLHDIGKYSVEFQNRLLKNGARVDHSTAGGFQSFCDKIFPAIFAILGHHGGIPDGGSMMDNQNMGTCHGRLNKAKKGGICDYADWKTEITPPIPAMIPTTDFLQMDFLIRMLYSCLVDADYLDTERFMINGDTGRYLGESMEMLASRLRHYVQGWFPPTTNLNEQRCRILKNCLDMGTREDALPGLFSLTVPTGGGKTVASLAFALEHAKRHNMKRVIYVIPYTSIIEQTADTFRRILGENNILEHHSGIDNGEDTGFVGTDECGMLDAESMCSVKAIENWDAPVIVTTAVRFFESLYANRPAQCRKVHNIAKSIIIFDEAQMLPIPYLQPCVSAISQLVKNYGCSAVLCTATQPSLNALFQQYLANEIPRELCSSNVYDSEPFHRVQYNIMAESSWENIAEEMKKQEQVLCIVNTRKNAQTLFEMLEGEKGTYHLSTLMYPEHRRRTISEIRRRLADGLSCRVVATSLIEAGVDVDFPAVYRELSGLDSILQAGGRCNREGKRPWQKSIVTVFRTNTAIPEQLQCACAACKNVLHDGSRISDNQTIQNYFQEYLDLLGGEAQDKKRIIEKINSGLFPFAGIAEEFKLIESSMRTIYIPVGRGKDLLEQLSKCGPTKSLLASLGQYGVSVYDNHFLKLMQAGDIVPITCGGTLFWMLQNTDLYCTNTGLSLEADSGKAIFV